MPREEGWAVDGISECLVPVGKSRQQGPFRFSVRHAAAVDRGTNGSVEPYVSACIEFAENSGLWFLVAFADETAHETWDAPLKAALRLLADSGYGGERSRGWGRAEMPDFTAGQIPDLLLPKNGEPKRPPKPVPAPVSEAGEEGPETTSVETPEEPPQAPPETAYWLLSLFSPGEADMVDWKRGAYSVLSRGGRVESKAGWGQPKQLLRMVKEGSVLFAEAPPSGRARDVAPSGFPHPVYRAGFALAVPIPWRVMA
jgi:CRISPR/Cas system CSM-associated protein Csm4 (group 5 of RAMP superfamily)